MAKLREIYLNGERFTIKRITVRMRKVRFEAWCDAIPDKNDIFKEYKKPSVYKVAIWNDWVEWSKELCYPYIQIRSANGWQFTIEGLIQFEEKWYYIDITKTHNWLFPIDIVED